MQSSHTFASIICNSDNDNENFTLSISNDYKVYSFGCSVYTAHGHKDINVYPPKIISSLRNIKMISCGAKHTLCLGFNGKVFSFGSNVAGQLGIDTSVKTTNIIHELDLLPITQISCGSYFSICISDTGSLYSFGNNSYGQLGLGDYATHTSPQLIPVLKNVEFIDCGEFHAICKTFNDKFYAWGGNQYGQLGLGNCIPHFSPTQCTNWPDDIIDIKCGYYHNLILTSAGQVYVFGDNLKGKLGINDTDIPALTEPKLIEISSKIRRIECNSNRAMCIDIDNNLWVFGSNLKGKLGLGDEEHRILPLKHPTLTNITDISSGGEHSFVKTFNNEIYAFGWNNSNQLGIKTPKDIQETPIQVFKDNEDIWRSFIGKSSAKSARK